MSEQLRMGLIGLGEIAYKSTAKALQTATNAVMVAGVDPVSHASESFQETYGIPCSTELAAVLERDDVDAVVISTPHYLHVPLGIAAARAGKHVIVEKPIATTLEDADALIRECRDAGVIVTSKESLTCYAPEAIRAKELVSQGAIGDVMAICIEGGSCKPDSYWTGGYSGRVQTTWRKSKAQAGGGILIMNYVYDVHRMRYVTGLEVTRVFGSCGTYRTDVEVEDFISVSLGFSNGATGSITVSSCVPGARASGPKGSPYQGNRIVGTAGQIVYGNGLTVYTEADVEGLPKGEWTSLELPDQDSAVAFFEAFAQAVADGREPDFPAQEGRRNLEVILAAYESGATGQAIQLPMGS